MWKNVGYYNGTMGPLEEMTVPMGDRALYFGDGIYEATCVANRVPFALDDHLDRMYNSLRLLEIPFKMERDQVKAELQKVIDAAEDSPIHFLYWQISRGVAMRNHPFPTDAEPTLLIYVKPHTMKSMDKPYKLISMEDIRFKLCNIKTLNLIPSVLANQRAVEHGCDEAVLHRGSRVTECAHSNISILKDGVLQTAPTDELILPGITRKHLLALAKEHGLDYAVDVYPHYSSDVAVSWKAGSDAKAALIGPGVQASHGMERTHWDGLRETIRLVALYLDCA